MLVFAATNPAVAALIKPMMDGAFLKNDPEMMKIVPVLFVVIFTIRGIADFTGGYTVNWIANKVIMDLRNIMYTRLLYLPSRYFDHHSAGWLISKFSFDVTQVRVAATTAVNVLVRDSLVIIGLLGWMFYINWKLSLFATICVPFLAVIISILRKRLRKMARKVQESMGDINNVLNESIHNHRTVKIYGGQEQELKQFFHVNENTRKFLMKSAVAAVATGPAIQFMSAFVIALIVVIATRQAAAGLLTVGEFISFFTAMAMILAPLKRLVGINQALQSGLAACESVFTLIDSEIETNTGNKELARARGKITFENTCFSYDEKNQTIRNVTFTIEPGETIALVGASGSGKSTLVNLLPAFYLPTSGSIKIDDEDIRRYTLESLRANIAVVSQETALFNDTIRNNIAYGAMRECSMDEIVAAADAAHALEFIRSFPDGFDTVIGESGTRLSGGQRQRLAIARAFLKDAPILLLDEATSALDRESESHIQSALEKIREGRTCIIIAHRLSTVAGAKRIFVIEDGKIVQTGTHQDLVAREGAYARLHQLDSQHY